MQDKKILSRHFTAHRAHQAATSARRATMGRRGLSSGWSHLEYSVRQLPKRRWSLRRWAVIEK